MSFNSAQINEQLPHLRGRPLPNTDIVQLLQDFDGEGVIIRVIDGKYVKLTDPNIISRLNQLSVPIAGENANLAHVPVALLSQFPVYIDLENAGLVVVPVKGHSDLARRVIDLTDTIYRGQK